MSHYHYHLNLIFLLVSFLSFTSNFFLMVPTTPNDIRAFASFRTIIHLYYNIKTFFFSILHHHFLKISTLDYIFYILLYSNNHFLYLFFFFVPIFFCYFPLFSKQTNNSTQNHNRTKPTNQPPNTTISSFLSTSISTLYPVSTHPPKLLMTNQTTSFLTSLQLLLLLLLNLRLCTWQGCQWRQTPCWERKGGWATELLKTKPLSWNLDLDGFEVYLLIASVVIM